MAKKVTIPRQNTLDPFGVPHPAAPTTTAGYADYPTLTFGQTTNRGAGGAAAGDAAPAAADPWSPIYKLAMSSIQTPQQILNMSRTRTLADEKATLAAMKAVSDQTIAQYHNQANRAQGFAQALGRLQAGEDQQAYARYNTSADRLTGIGTGLTGDVAEQYQGAVDKSKELVAQLTGGLGQVSAPEAADIRNAAQYAGVTGPAGSLVDQAIPAARMAQSDAASRRQNLANIGIGYDAQANAAIAQAASDARAQIAKRPSTIAELVQQLTTNRQTNVSNLANVLSARTTWKQNEQKRVDDAAQRAIENQRATRQLDITERGIDMSQRLQMAQLTGRDPVTGAPTFSREQWDATTDQGKKSFAVSQGSSLGYQIDWKTGLAKIVDGHVVPNAGYKIDPKNPYAVLPIFKPTAGSSSGKVLAGTGGMKGKDWQEFVTSQKDWATLAAKGNPGGYELIQPQYDKNGVLTTPAKWVPNPGAPATAPKPYSEVLQGLLAGGPNTPLWQQRAHALANSIFPQGTSDRPWDNPKLAANKLVTLSKKHHFGYQEIIGTAQQNNIPVPLVEKALKTLYPNVWGRGAGAPAVAGDGGYGPTHLAPMAAGSKWDPKTDKPTFKAGPNGTVWTKSGHLVDPKTGLYVEAPEGSSAPKGNPFAIKGNPNNPFAIKPVSPLGQIGA